MDVLPFDLLCNLFEFLPITGLVAVSVLGDLYKEAALSVARRRQLEYSCDLYASTKKPFDILVKCMRKLIVHGNTADVMERLRSPSVVDLITSAELLVDLTMYDVQMDHLCYEPTFLSRIQRLTLANGSATDAMVAALLRTCSPDTLTELVVSSGELSGGCLLAVNGQLDVLRIEGNKLNCQNLFRMCKMYPRLQKLTIGGIQMFRMSARFWESGCLLHLRELRLCTHISLDKFSLAEMPELHTLELWFEGQIDENDLLKLCRATGSKHKLRMLCIRARDIQFSQSIGAALLHLAQLDTLYIRLIVCVRGVNQLLRGIAPHPALRSVRLSKCILQSIDITRTVYHHMQHIEHLKLHACMDDDLLLLARMPNLRTLRVNLDFANSESESIVIFNQFVQELAAANTLTVLHVRFSYYDSGFSFDPLTAEALRRFSGLRELELLGEFAFDSVQAVLCNMPELESFANYDCIDEVSERQLELKRMRPLMRITVE